MKTNKELDKKIVKILDKIRPYIVGDGGDVHFVKFEDGVVYVSVSGACVGCGALPITLKMGIENLLVSELEEVKSVELYDEPFEEEDDEDDFLLWSSLDDD